jgi:prevent-host-death family protein
MSRMLKASEFKAKCLALLDEVKRTRERIVITKHGKPIADIIPHVPQTRNARGILKDELFIAGDIISPIDVEWEATK